MVEADTLETHLNPFAEVVADDLGNCIFSSGYTEVHTIDCSVVVVNHEIHQTLDCTATLYLVVLAWLRLSVLPMGLLVLGFDCHSTMVDRGLKALWAARGLPLVPMGHPSVVPC